MTSPVSPNPTTDQPTSSDKWSPWWIYVIVLLGANYLRTYFMSDSSLPIPLIAAIAIGQAALLFVVITAIWRAFRRGKN